MMESIIEKIFHKELGRRETIPKNKEYQKIHDEYFKAYETLEKTLDENQIKLLSDLYLAHGELEGISDYISFEDGFRAGILLGIELYTNSET